MKKAFWFIVGFVLVFSLGMGFAYANPWVVCDPQTDAEGYVFWWDGSQETHEVAYSEVTKDGLTVVPLADCSGLSTGLHVFHVYAFNIDPVWGTRRVSETVPFDVPVPEEGGIGNVTIPSGFRLMMLDDVIQQNQ